jgi:hypothetical protein
VSLRQLFSSHSASVSYAPTRAACRIASSRCMDDGRIVTCSIATYSPVAFARARTS